MELSTDQIRALENGEVVPVIIKLTFPMQGGIISYRMA